MKLLNDPDAPRTYFPNDRAEELVAVLQADDDEWEYGTEPTGLESKYSYIFAMDEDGFLGWF